MRFKVCENLYDSQPSGLSLPVQGTTSPDSFEMQLSSQLLDLIKDKLNIIDKFNAFKQCLIQADEHLEMLEVVNKIIEDDNKEVGNLQGLLQYISDDAKLIDVGQLEVEKVLN